MSTTQHPVDSTYHPCCRAIGQHSRQCPDGPAATFAQVSDPGATMPGMSTTPGRHDLIDVGPATPAPAWCLPGTEPDWGNRTEDGQQVCMWGRSIGDGCVHIGCDDEVIGGRVLRSPPRIFGTEEPPRGWTADQARELAAQLVAAADLIDQAAAL